MVQVFCPSFFIAVQCRNCFLWHLDVDEKIIHLNLIFMAFLEHLSYGEQLVDEAGLTTSHKLNRFVSLEFN